MTYTSLFAGQVTSVAKELAERKRRPQALESRRASASSSSARQQNYSHFIRAQPAKPRSSACSSLATPHSSCGRPSVLFSGLLEVHNKGPVCVTPLTWTSPQFRHSATSDNQRGALPTARGQQQDRAPKGGNPLHVGKGSHREGGEQVLAGGLQSAIVLPSKNGKLR